MKHVTERFPDKQVVGCLNVVTVLHYGKCRIKVLLELRVRIT